MTITSLKLIAFEKILTSEYNEKKKFNKKTGRSQNIR